LLGTACPQFLPPAFYGGSWGVTPRYHPAWPSPLPLFFRGPRRRDVFSRRWGWGGVALSVQQLFQAIGRAGIAAPAPGATILWIHPRGSGGNFGRILQHGGLNLALASLSASAGVLSSVNAWYLVGVIIDGNGGDVKPYRT